MERYDNNVIVKQMNTPRYRSTTRYPEIPLSINDLYIITQFGDRLDNLAYQFYQDTTLWWVISAANPNLPKDSLYPPAGYQLRIPNELTQILNNFEQINS